MNVIGQLLQLLQHNNHKASQKIFKKHKNIFLMKLECLHNRCCLVVFFPLQLCKMFVVWTEGGGKKQHSFSNTSQHVAILLISH